MSIKTKIIVCASIVTLLTHATSFSREALQCVDKKFLNSNNCGLKANTFLSDDDLRMILTSDQPLVYIGSATERGMDTFQSVVTLSDFQAILKEMQAHYKLEPVTVNIVNNQKKNATKIVMHKCYDALLPKTATYEIFTFVFDDVVGKQKNDTNYLMMMDAQQRSLNDSYIKINADNNVDMRITGSSSFLGQVNLPAVAKTNISGSFLAIDAGGKLGVTASLGVGPTYTFTSDIFMNPTTTFWVNKIDPRSPTTTVTFSGAISLPNTTTANHGSLQINGVPFLHNFGTTNTFVGPNAGNMKTSAGNNIGIGSGALSGITTGAGNIGIGTNAGNALTTGANNIDIGSVGVAAEANTIRVGTTGTQTACFVAGISNVTVIGTAVTVNSNGQLGVVLSSAKYKDDIQAIDDQTDNLMKLKPTSFTYKDPNIASIRQYGLIAEQVAAVDPTLVVYKEGSPESVRYDVLPVVLLSGYQKMHDELIELRARINKLECNN